MEGRSSNCGRPAADDDIRSLIDRDCPACLLNTAPDTARIAGNGRDSGVEFNRDHRNQSSLCHCSENRRDPGRVQIAAQGAGAPGACKINR